MNVAMFCFQTKNISLVRNPSKFLYISILKLLVMPCEVSLFVSLIHILIWPLLSSNYKLHRLKKNTHSHWLLKSFDVESRQVTWSTRDQTFDTTNDTWHIFFILEIKLEKVRPVYIRSFEVVHLCVINLIFNWL